MAKTLGLDIGAAPAAKTSNKHSKQASTNTSKKEASKPVDLNFKVTAEFKRDFKIWATTHDLSQKETLERAFALLKQHGL